jgi:hypothetical protein
LFHGEKIPQKPTVIDLVRDRSFRLGGIMITINSEKIDDKTSQNCPFAAFHYLNFQESSGKLTSLTQQI